MSNSKYTKLLFVGMVISWCSPILCAQSTPAFVNDTPDDHDAVKIGWFLEQEFSPYFNNCSNNQPMKTKDNVVVSTVPVPILTAIQDDVWNWVYNKHTYTAALAFSIISADQTLPSSPNANFQLGMDVLQDPGTMLAAGTSSTLYSSNCTSIVAAAASVDSNLKFSLASLSTVAKADYQNSTTGELGLIRGDFNSPFFQMYGGLVSPASTQFAHFLLWDWYKNRYSSMANVPVEKFFALGWFNGYSMYQVSKNQRSADGSVKVAGSASYLGLVSVSGSLQTQFQQFGSTSVTNYAFAIRAYDPTPKYRFDPLESPDQIVAWAKQAASTTFNAPPPFSSVLSQALPSNATHEQVFTAIPADLCDHTLWTPNPSTTAAIGSVKVVGERQIPISSTQVLPSCALSIFFTPDAAVWASPVGSVVNLHYALDTKVADKTLEIAAAPVSFSTSNYPFMQPALIGPAGFKATPADPGPGSTVEWNINEVLVDDPGDPIDRTQAITVINQPLLSNCTSAAGAIGIPANGASFVGGLVAIKIQQYFASAPDPSSAQNTTCTVALTLRFKTGKAHLVAAALPPNTLLAYPPPPKPSAAAFKITATPQ